jgi:NhaA family Na+:H+ antiporter
LFAFSYGRHPFTLISAPGSVEVLIGVVAGLVLGKPGDLSGFSRCVSSIARAPDDAAVGQFIGAACLCGIGDTSLCSWPIRLFPMHVLNVAKLSVLIGSLIAAAVGSVVIAAVCRKTQSRPTTNSAFFYSQTLESPKSAGAKDTEPNRQLRRLPMSHAEC